MTLDEEDIGFHFVMPFLNRGIAEMNHEEKGTKKDGNILTGSAAGRVEFFKAVYSRI